MSQSNSIKVQAWIGSAWYRDCDPFLSIAFNPSKRYGKSKCVADNKLVQLAQLDAKEQWRGCDSGERLCDWLDSVCVSGCFLESVELNPAQVEDFQTRGFCFMEVL